MRLSAALGVGVPMAALAVAATIAGPDRLAHLACRLDACPTSTHVERLCRMAEALPEGPDRARRLHAAYRATWPPADARALFEAVEAAAPGAELDVLLDAVTPAPLCAGLQGVYGGAVTLTPRRLVVRGQPLLDLEGGVVAEPDLEGEPREIRGLIDTVGPLSRRAPLEVTVAGSLPYRTLAQAAHTLGRAGAPGLEVVVPGAARVSLDLPPAGTCPGCLASLAEVELLETAPPDTLLVAPVTRLGRDGVEVAFDPRQAAVLALPEDGRYVWRPEAQGPATRAADLEGLVAAPASTRTVLAVLAAPGRRVADVARAIAAVRGGFATVVLAEPRRGLRHEAPLEALVAEDRRVFLGTQAILSAARESRPRRRPRAAFTRRSPVTARSIADLVRPKLRGLRMCYEDALKLDSYLAGKVTLRFDVTDSGRTDNVQLEDHSLGSPRVTECIARKARYWRLPPPEGGPITVAYPLVFTPAGT